VVQGAGPEFKPQYKKKKSKCSINMKSGKTQKICE
jgi:hypothetical protein